MTQDTPVALVTGASKRIGLAIAHHLHTKGYSVIVHYHHSEPSARELCQTLNKKRPESACAIACDLSQAGQIESFADNVLSRWDRLDVLINNASMFVPDDYSSLYNLHQQWQNLFNTNALANLLLSTALRESLKQNQGNIINLIDIYAQRPLPQHTLYSTSKAASEMLTKSLALELAPDVRVNGISPGAILWPEKEPDDEHKAKLLKQIPLQRIGSTQPIIEAVEFLLRCDYITGQIITVDGGRSITI